MAEEVKKKRKRRTKAEMKEARRLEAEQKEKKRRRRKGSYWDNLPPMKTKEEVCQEMLNKAKSLNYEEPEFDFRDDFASRDNLYFCEVNKLFKTVKLLEVKVSTVYPRSIITYIDNGEAHIITYSDKDYVFRNRFEADEKIKEIRKELKKL